MEKGQGLGGSRGRLGQGGKKEEKSKGKGGKLEEKGRKRGEKEGNLKRKGGKTGGKKWRGKEEKEAGGDPKGLENPGGRWELLLFTDLGDFGSP